MNFEVAKERFELLRKINTDMGFHMLSLVDHCDAVDARTVIELGTRYGASTIAFIMALYAKQNARLYSVDCSFPIMDPETGIELLNSQGALGCVDYWTFLLGYDTNDMILSALPDRNVDIVFIDTNHMYEETVRELELYYPRVREGGRIILHDTNISHTGNAVTPQPLFPVRTAVDEFCSEHQLRSTFVDESFGMGTIYCD